MFPGILFVVVARASRKPSLDIRLVWSLSTFSFSFYNTHDPIGCDSIGVVRPLDIVGVDFSSSQTGCGQLFRPLATILALFPPQVGLVSNVLIVGCACGCF